MGVPRLPAGSVDTNATTFGMGTVSKYPIRRRALRGKKPPTHVRPVSVGKAKKHSLAFLIHDDDFPLVPQPGQKLAPGMKRRVSPARTRKDVLARLKEITQLASRHDLGLGAAVAEGAIDALGLGEATTPKRKKLMVDANGNVINPKFLPTPATTSTNSFALAIRRLHEFGIASSITSGAGRFLPEVGAIAGGDLIGESVHDRLKAAQDKKKRRLLRQRGGVEPLPGMGTAAGTMTTMSAVDDTLNEFAHGKERVDRAKRTGTTIAAAGAGGALGAYAGLRHEPGHVAQPGEIQPGSTIYRRREGFIPTRHYGTVDSQGRVAHRTAGSSKIRNVTTESFRKLGKGRTYVESPRRGDRTPSQIAAAASAAKGTSAGRYSTLGNNCEHATSKLSGGKAVSRQVRRGVAGLVGGAVVGGTMAEILNRKNRKDK